MHRTWILALVLASALAPAAMAHEGHTHKALGVVSSVQGSQVEVKTTDGKTIKVTLDAKTAITRGKTTLTPAALKVGERVSIDYVQAKSVNTAKSVKLGETPAAAPK